MIPVIARWSIFGPCKIHVMLVPCSKWAIGNMPDKWFDYFLNHTQKAKPEDRPHPVVHSYVVNITIDENCSFC